MDFLLDSKASLGDGQEPRGGGGLADPYTLKKQNVLSIIWANGTSEDWLLVA